MKHLLVFLLVGPPAIGAAKDAKAPKIIDLGVGGVESNLAGAQYLSRIRGSLNSLLSEDAVSFEKSALEDLERRHLEKCQSGKHD